MKRLILLLFLALPLAAATNDNDDSCDISVLPAATLLLPYFEVDLDGFARDGTTLFTITNVTNLDRVAHVTLLARRETDRAVHRHRRDRAGGERKPVSPQSKQA